MTSNFVVKLIVMWSNFDPHDKQNFAPQTMSAASGTIMMYGNNKPYAKLDLSKLCEFCIKSCAERRKMTAVN